MLANEGISDDLFKAFLIYLVSHPRPAHELLCPRRLDISAQYSDEFLGMTVADLWLDALLEARERLVREIRSEEHSSELQSLMRISYAVFCLKKNNTNTHTTKLHKPH